MCSCVCVHIRARRGRRLWVSSVGSSCLGLSGAGLISIRCCGWRLCEMWRCQPRSLHWRGECSTEPSSYPTPTPMCMATNCSICFCGWDRRDVQKRNQMMNRWELTPTQAVVHQCIYIVNNIFWIPASEYLEEAVQTQVPRPI